MHRLSLWMLVAGFASQSLAQQPVIVNNPTPNANAPAFRIAAAPVLTIDGNAAADTLYELYSVRDGALTSKGGFIVVNNNGESIREYDAKGKFVRNIGRKGAGPGEFRSIGDIRLIAGDTLVLSDGTQKRITMFGPDGLYARTITGLRAVRCCTSSGIFLDRARAAPSMGRSMPLTDADWAIGALRSPKEPAAASASQAPLDVAFRPDAVPHVSFPADPATISITEARTNPTTGGSASPIWHSFGLPFASSPMLGFGDSTIVTMVGDRYEFQVLAPSGRVLRVVRSAVMPTVVTPERLAATRAGFIASYKEPALQASLARAFDSASLPKTISPVDRMMVEEDGTVWLRNALVADSLPRTWAKFDRNGRLQGTLVLPADFVTLRFSRGHVIARKRDPNADFEKWMVFAIVPAR